MTKMSKKDRAEGEAIAVDIRRRPAFHAACVWLERARRTYGDAVTGQADKFQDGWVYVDGLAGVIQAHIGVYVADETAMCALETNGFKLRVTRRGTQTNLAESVLLEAWQSTDYGKSPARRLPNLSDLTDPQRGMH